MSTRITKAARRAPVRVPPLRGRPPTGAAGAAARHLPATMHAVRPPPLPATSTAAVHALRSLSPLLVLLPLLLPAILLLRTPSALAQNPDYDAESIHSGVPFITELEWAGDQRDLDAANKALSGIVREALEVEGANGASDLVQPKELPDLYFHDDRYKITVATERVAAAARADWLVLQSDAFLEQQHVELQILLPRVLLAGRYLLDRKAHGDFKTREEGVFRLEQRNVTVAGLAELRAAKGGALQVGRVLLAAKANSQRFEKSRQRRAPQMRQFVESGALQEGLQRRLEREVTRLLEDAVRQRLRPVMAQHRLGDVLPRAADQRLLAAYEEQTTESADGFVDLLLGAARTLLNKNDTDADHLRLPDLREGFEKTFVVITIHGGFVATQGYARGLSSAHRYGDSFFAHHPNGSGFSIWGGIAFDNLQMTYGHYEAQVMGLGPSGSLSAEVYPLVLHIHVRVDFDADHAYLEEFRIDQAGELQVEVTGLGFLLNWLASQIATWVLSAYRDRVVDEVQSRYASYFSNILDGVSIDKLINKHTFY